MTTRTRLVLVTATIFGLIGCSRVAELPPPSTPLVSSPADARREAPRPPPGRAPSLPEGRAYRIPNGASLWFAHAPAAEHTRLMLVSRRGDDGAHVHGLSSLVASYLGRRAADRIDHAVGSGGADAHGSYVFVDVAPRDVERAMQELRKSITHEPIDAEELLKHLESSIEELRDTQPSQRVIMTGMRQLAGQEVTTEDVHLARIRELRAYDEAAAEAVRRERFAPSESVLVVVGPHEPAALWTSFRTAFGDWLGDPPRREGRAPTERPPARAAVSEHVEGADLLQLLMVRRAPAMASPDRPAFDVLTALAASSFSSRLMTSLREQEQVTYGAHGWVDSSAFGDVLVLTSAFAPDEASRGMQRFFDELRRLRSEPVERHELEVAVRQLWSRLRHSMEGVGVASFLADAWTAGLPPGELMNRYVALGELSPEALREVARRTLEPSSGLVLVTGDLDDVGGMWIVRTSEGFVLREDPNG
jgi:predicted Zn-dependent peptidase